MPFTFKQFHIDDQDCGMPVSTDAVVLGAWAPLENARQILDIGAGSGLLSLMAAQRSQAQITAVEIDTGAAKACAANIGASPWAQRIKLYQGDITGFVAPQTAGGMAGFDHIICNPPYFETGPQSAKAGRAVARHTESLPFHVLAQQLQRLLAPQGQASLILPLASLPAWREAVAQHSALQLIRQCDVISVRGKAPKRALLLMQHSQSAAGALKQDQLVIREPDNSYSEQMHALTRNFYLFMT
ncbi:tRNA1(Val) (adenine(37)-N6)-methyltransferase [Shewanella sp. GXUN23E]|uniref:tRNA1(Val) (adenine(37)-N6)-methyltransferase n=1 Tax=Shewanella sp. GXUN23E TaxID=3422498 RepID=UPI003D7ED4A9